MFIEVYKIPMVNWTEPSVSSAVPENRKLINLNQIKDVDYSSHCEGRAEIEYHDGSHITVVGSYDDIVTRIGIAVSEQRVVRVV